jgi:tetratricopeptide (TPR) repeat protein
MGDDPEGEMAHNAGLMLYRTGDLENANVFLRNALSVSPDKLAFISSRLSCLLDLGKYAEAEEMLTQARLRKPSAELMELFQELYSGRCRVPPPRRMPPKPVKKAAAGKAADRKTGAEKPRKTPAPKPAGTGEPKQVKTSAGKLPAENRRGKVRQ